MTREKIETIKRLLKHTKNYVQHELSAIYSRELVDLIFAQPYCRIANLADAGIAKRQTASAYLKQLVDIGVLKEIKIGREKLFVHPNLIHILIQDSNEYEGYS